MTGLSQETTPQDPGKKTLLLVDASSYLYRAFHALPDLRNRAGEPTGAVYGVLGMLRRLRQDYPADYSACVFDAKGKTFREEWYSEYKAHRPPMPEDLVRQLEPLRRCIAALGWPLLMIEGVEADDVIGTLTTLAAAHGIRAIVSTGDKDLAQLVGPSVTLVNTLSNEVLDEAGVAAKFGVPPALMVDYLSLMGDPVDNVPGVEKVGPKTAVKWLAQYGSLDSIMARAGEIRGVVGENLRKALPWLPQARRLVTVRRDVPLPVALEDLAPRPPDTAVLAQWFERLEFKAWRRELAVGGEPADAPAGDPPDAPQRRYETLLEWGDIERWLAVLDSAQLVSLDTETTGLDPMTAQLVGLSFCAVAGHAAYLPLAHRYTGAPPQLDRQAVLEKLRPWLENSAKAKVGQNLKFDWHVLANHGIRLAGIAHDTLLQSYVLESHKPHDLDNLAARHLQLKTIGYDEVTGKGAKRIGFEEVAVERAAEYAAEDADIALRLHQTLFPRVQRHDGLYRVYRDIEMPVMRVLFAMERHGVLVDASLLERQSRELGERLVALESEAHRQAAAPFNLNSAKQVQEILFDRLKLPVLKKTPGGAPSTDEDVLGQLALDFPLPKLLLEYRGLAKLKSTYTDKLPRMVNPATGRIHTHYAQAVAVTGRLASSDPNLQNIPARTQEGRRIREAFIAPPGSVLVSADYSQIELRIMAHLSRDPHLLHAFAQGADVHRATAAEIFGLEPEAVSSEQRRYAKVINFGLIYGMSAFGLASQLGIERSAAQQYMDRYFTRYPGVAAYMERTREAARSQGYVETVFGRRLFLPDIRAGSPARRQAAERAAINAPMQGTAADLIKLATVAVQSWIEAERLDSRIILQVHDELVLEAPRAEQSIISEHLPRLMTQVARLEVPLLVDVGSGRNWEEAH